MADKNLLRRLEHIEDLLGNEPSPGELSPDLKEAVDRLIRREPPIKDKTKAVEKVSRRVSKEILSPALRESVDRLIGRLSNTEKVPEDSKGGKDE